MDIQAAAAVVASCVAFASFAIAYWTMRSKARGKAEADKVNLLATVQEAARDMINALTEEIKRLRVEITVLTTQNEANRKMMLTHETELVKLQGMIAAMREIRDA